MQAAFAFQDSIEVELAEGELVATQVKASGTHIGPFHGLAATGKQVTWTAAVFHRVIDGTITERWVTFDLFGLLQQLQGDR